MSTAPGLDNAHELTPQQRGHGTVHDATTTQPEMELQSQQQQQLPEEEEKVMDSSSSAPSTIPAPVEAQNGVPHVEPSVLAPENLQRYAEGFSDLPPPLPYSCWDRKLSICIFWFFILAETCLIPISFYYGFMFGTHLRHGIVFAIITSVFGFVSGYEYGCRGYLLLLPTDKYRPLFSASRWGFDSLQWLLLTPYGVLTGILIGGSIPEEPLARVLAMPMAVGNIILGSMFVANGIAVQRKWRLPFRMSSHLKGSVCPPITYSIIEDVVCVDGGAGKVYREALMQRYNASPRFRKMLIQIVWFWGVPSIVVGAVLLALIFTVKKEVAYGLGWSVPNIWAIIWTVLTVIWVRRSLRIEKQMWHSDRTAPP